MLLNESYGMADFEKNMPFSDQVRFYYGSITKQFVAISVMIIFGIANAKFGSHKSDVNSYCVYNGKRCLLGKGKYIAGDACIVMSQAEMMKYLSRVGKVLFFPKKVGKQYYRPI